MSVGKVIEESLCEKLVENYQENSVILLLRTESVSTSPLLLHVIHGSDTKDILENVLVNLPNPEIVNEEKFKVNFFIDEI